MEFGLGLGNGEKKRLGFHSITLVLELTSRAKAVRKVQTDTGGVNMVSHRLPCVSQSGTQSCHFLAILQSGISPKSKEHRMTGPLLSISPSTLAQKQLRLSCKVIVLKLSEPCNSELPSRFWAWKFLGWSESVSPPLSVTSGQGLGVLHFILLGISGTGFGKTTRNLYVKLNPNINRYCRRIMVAIAQININY